MIELNMNSLLSVNAFWCMLAGKLFIIDDVLYSTNRKEGFIFVINLQWIIYFIKLIILKNLI